MRHDGILTCFWDDDNQDGSDVDGGAVSEPDRLDCADRSAC